eukprot:CAMPEP_0182457304 /NCGR_PEP_ID=MMETSP1319-20130603/2900_1 /TAXON_ID=172717 /ORGANISM="Bolidomonas pacifica, Strain RCC208" /LENGTH=479 /DNA_ID=CAMNT_0024655737 /DNA_START=167 /DNA_END=1603 /DNA_ORIENTATION=+
MSTISPYASHPVKRTLELAFEAVRTRLRSLDAVELPGGARGVDFAECLAALKAGLLEANERATTEMEESRDSNRDSVAPREMVTIVKDDLSDAAPDTSDVAPATPPPPPPPPPPPTSTTTLRVSVDAAVKMEEGMFRDYIQYTIVTELIVDDPEDYDCVPDIKTFKVGRRYRDFDGLSQRLAGLAGLDSAEALSSSLYSLGSVLPSLPPKRALRISRNTKEDHAESRRRALQYWLRHIIAHPTLRAAVPLREFLTGKGEGVWVEPQVPLNPIQRARPEHRTTLGYRVVIKESLNKLSMQSDRLLAPLSNAMENTETLSTLMHHKIDSFTEFSNSLQALPQCEKRGSVERFCWSAMCAGAAGSIGSIRRIATSLEFDLLDLLRHHSISVLPVFRGRVMALKDQASSVVRKMQRSDELRHTISSDADGGSYSQVARPVAPMTGKEDETGRRPSLKALSDGIEESTALLNFEWRVLNKIRSA